MASLENSPSNDQAEVNEILSFLVGTDPAEPICAAIREHNEQKLRETCRNLRGLLTISPKREAIGQGNPEFLRILLEVDNTVTEDLVAFACDRRDKNSLRALLDFGWDINRPVRLTASILW